MIKNITFLYLLLVAILPIKAQTFTTLHSFTNTDGQFPAAGLVLASNVLYGTTVGGTSQSNGTVFAVNTDGSNFRVLHAFTATDPVTETNSDGANPYAGLVLSGDTLFGITTQGGTNFGYGTIFSINTNGSNFCVLHQFDGSNGYSPHARLLLSAGKLYGTTYWGGKFADMAYGTMFSINTNGTDFNVMLNFTGYPYGGVNPEGDLILVGNVFYGTTYGGGIYQDGTVFSFETNDVVPNTIYNFSGNPFGPASGLISSGNKLYGTAAFGTTNGQLQYSGAIFSIDTSGSNYVVLHYFTAADPVTFTNVDGALPDADLMLSGNTLYGTTSLGGSQSNGVVFELNTDGSGYTVLHNFTGIDPNTYTNADGANSESSLVMSDNTLYGTAGFGGSYGGGTIFSLQLPSVAGIILNQDGSVTINFSGGAATNLVQVSTNLSSPAFWQTISTNAAGTNGLWQFTDTNVNTSPFRFYRSATP
jgi:uncharacterized repeat protein (TIGR03803 family)